MYCQDVLESSKDVIILLFLVWNDKIPAMYQVQLRSYHGEGQLSTSLKKRNCIIFLSAASHKHTYANLQCDAADGAVL